MPVARSGPAESSSLGFKDTTTDLFLTMVVSDLARSGSVCVRVDGKQGSTPPPVIVKVHLKRHLRENPALLSVIDGKRNNHRYLLIITYTYIIVY